MAGAVGAQPSDRSAQAVAQVVYSENALTHLEDGVPTDAYSLDEAVRDGFLVSPKAVSVPLKFQREGIKYDDLSEEEKEQWDALEWDVIARAAFRVDAAGRGKRVESRRSRRASAQPLS